MKARLVERDPSHDGLEQHVQMLAHSTASLKPSQATPSSTLMTPPIQSTKPNPFSSLDSQPPHMPPNSNITAALALRFLFTFCHVNSFESLARSLYTLVRTVVGISLYPNARLAATCAPNCQARSGMPIRIRSLSGEFSGMTSVFMRMAATKMDKPWRRKFRHRDNRRVWPKRRVTVVEMRDPSMKVLMEMSDRSHRRGTPFRGRPATPKARKTVFPLLTDVC